MNSVAKLKFNKVQRDLYESDVHFQNNQVCFV